MSKNRWLSLAVLGQFVFFVVTAAPHTVHHGLDDVDSQECAVFAATLHADGQLPEDLSLSIILSCTHDVSISHHIFVQKQVWEDYRTRAPPLSLTS